MSVKNQKMVATVKIVSSFIYEKRLYIPQIRRNIPNLRVFRVYSEIFTLQEAQFFTELFWADAGYFFEHFYRPPLAVLAAGGKGFFY